MKMPFSKVRRHAQLGRLISIIVLIVAGTQAAAFASDLKDYQDRLGSARARIDELKKTDQRSERLSRTSVEKLAQIRVLIPKTEQLEWPGGHVETDNQWLHTETSNFENEADGAKRKDLLLGMDERLLALTKSVGEIQNPTAEAPSKDQNKQKLAEILRRVEFQKPEAQGESLFQKWWREFLEWLDRVFPKPGLTPASADGLGPIKTIVEYLIFAAVIALIGFLIYRFVPYFAQRRMGRSKKKKQGRVILGERIGDDASAADLFDEAETLAGEGKLRAAIRKGYIAILCELSDRKVIGLARHKTNRDYLGDVRRNTGLFENMKDLTGNFERNWYGAGTAEQADWEDFRDRYRQTIESVKGSA